MGYYRKLADDDNYSQLHFDLVVLEAYEAVPAPNLAILQTCKQVSKEALAIGWESSVKCFNDNAIFIAFVPPKVGPLLPFNYLNKLQLDLILKSWFRFFVMDVAQNDDPTIRLDTWIRVCS
jgi:hypothetical protein